jgi:hypothetical protein
MGGWGSFISPPTKSSTAWVDTSNRSVDKAVSECKVMTVDRALHQTLYLLRFRVFGNGNSTSCWRNSDNEQLFHAQHKSSNNILMAEKTQHFRCLQFVFPVHYNTCRTRDAADTYTHTYISTLGHAGAFNQQRTKHDFEPFFFDFLIGLMRRHT